MALRRALPSDFPEGRALRILFYPVWARVVYLQAWLVTAVVLPSLMTYRSIRPLELTDVAVALGIGGLMPLVAILGAEANRAAKSCRGAGTARRAPGLALVFSLFAAATSCMCCLPILPIVLGTVMAGTLAASQVAGVASAGASWAPWLYLGSALLLGWSLHRYSRALVEAVDRTECPADWRSH